MSITDDLGATLDGTEVGAPGNDFNLEFYVLPGDTANQQTVTFAEAKQIVPFINLSAGDDGYNYRQDILGQGTITFAEAKIIVPHINDDVSELSDPTPPMRTPSGFTGSLATETPGETGAINDSAGGPLEQATMPSVSAAAVSQPIVQSPTTVIATELPPDNSPSGVPEATGALTADRLEISPWNTDATSTQLFVATTGVPSTSFVAPAPLENVDAIAEPIVPQAIDTAPRTELTTSQFAGLSTLPLAQNTISNKSLTASQALGRIFTSLSTESLANAPLSPLTTELLDFALLRDEAEQNGPIDLDSIDAFFNHLGRDASQSLGSSHRRRGEAYKHAEGNSHNKMNPA